MHSQLIGPRLSHSELSAIARSSQPETPVWGGCGGVGGAALGSEEDEGVEAGGGGGCLKIEPEGRCYAKTS